MKLNADALAFLQALQLELIDYKNSLDADNRDDTVTFEEVFTEAGIIPQWIERGIEQGKEEKALAIARNLLAKGWAVEDAAETTDLSLEKVRSLVID
jgi:predicted transposase/invertase (TIGR01784 family)